MRQWNKEVTQGWRLVEVRGGAGHGLAFCRAEGWSYGGTGGRRDGSSRPSTAMMGCRYQRGGRETEGMGSSHAGGERARPGVGAKPSEV
jgi:hypothetical protein